MKLLQLQMDITNKCNMSCDHCRNGILKEEEITELSYDECIQIFYEAKKLGCESVNICGGEPLLHKNVLDIIKTISKEAFTILLTNGYLIDDELALELKDANVNLVQISLDSSLPQTHNSLRNCKTAFEHVVRATKALNKYDIETCFMVTLSKINKDELHSILELSKELKVSFVNFRRLIPQGNGKSNFSDLSLTKAEIEEILNEAKELEKNYSIGICLFPYYILKDQKIVSEYNKHPATQVIGGCAAGVAGLAISSNGNIQICPHIPKRLGNIRTDNITDVWNTNEEILKLRDRTNLKGKCGKCKYSNICGGCRAYSYQQTGDLLGEDELCTEMNDD